MNWLKRFWKGLTEPGQGSRPLVEGDLSNFTPRAQQVLALARKEAGRFNHNFVGTEHLLLGLIALGQGVAVNVLRNMGVVVENLQIDVEKQIRARPDEEIVGDIPINPCARNVLLLAAKEAKALHHSYVGTEHILLGLMHESDCVPNKILASVGVNIEATRREVLKEVDALYVSTPSNPHC